MSGPLRAILRVLGGVGVLWVVLGLAGIFVYLVVDSLRGPGSPHREAL